MAKRKDGLDRWCRGKDFRVQFDADLKGRHIIKKNIDKLKFNQIRGPNRAIYLPKNQE